MKAVRANTVTQETIEIFNVPQIGYSNIQTGKSLPEWWKAYLMEWTNPIAFSAADIPYSSVNKQNDIQAKNYP